MTMKFVFYTHSLVSDWNHGNAHFLRGILGELVARGHEVAALEPADSWSRSNLLKDQGPGPIECFHLRFPDLPVSTYDARFDHGAAVDEADVVVVHEWTDPGIVADIGRRRREGARFTLLFHDTHHRAVSDSAAMAALTLGDYDGVLAFGEALRERYLAQGWGDRVFTWHEAADTRLFRPLAADGEKEDLVWIGNWGDGERSRELAAFLVEPARALDLSGSVHGVRYPAEALALLAATRLQYRGWIANADVPAVFARHRASVHIPRRPYVEALPGIPTIRVFEALACGIPLVCAQWEDVEGLFRPGDYLVARNGDGMAACLADILRSPDLAAELARRGVETIRARHTCAHRVDELLDILARLGTAPVGWPRVAAEAAP